MSQNRRSATRHGDFFHKNLIFCQFDDDQKSKMSYVQAMTADVSVQLVGDPDGLVCHAGVSCRRGKIWFGPVPMRSTLIPKDVIFVHGVAIS